MNEPPSLTADVGDKARLVEHLVDQPVLINQAQFRRDFGFKPVLQCNVHLACVC